jgi:DNA polymerase III alpha subunit
MDRMKTTELHETIIDEDDVIDVLYKNNKIDNIVVDDPNWINQFNDSCDKYGLPSVNTWSVKSILSLDEYLNSNLSNWHLPQEYIAFDVESYLVSICITQEQVDRIKSEMVEFNKRGMIIVLQWIKYFVDTMRQNNLVWGVGRGSSVSSYVLFLLGAHKIDSLKYNLDIKEFLK